MQKEIYKTDIGGKQLQAEFTDLADQANGSVMLRYGNTVILATATMSDEPKEGIEFFPLTVDYEEKFYAAGQILGSRFQRREGRPSEEATLTSRVIDRTIRPLFPEGLRNEVQVVVTVLSIGDDDPDILAINAASLALATSDIPWNGPVSAARMVRFADGSHMVNPTYPERQREDLTLETIVCGKDLPAPQSNASRQAGGNINMIEAGAYEATEEDVVKTLTQGSQEIETFQEFQQKIIAEHSQEKYTFAAPALSQEEKDLFAQEITPIAHEYVFSGAGKAGHKALEKKWMEIYKEHFPEGQTGVARAYLDTYVDDLIHEEALNGNRADGRKADEIRELYTGVGSISELLHGTGVFYRGGTHVLSVLTLGGPDEKQIIDGMEEQTKKRFMHHYNFPPFSVGETGRIGVNRRMIGHGALAEKALSYVLPTEEEFPYTIRIVSESTASNGSTSMASTCGSTLALMDAGVPIKAPVAGIAMGLMMKNKDEYKVLTDIQGPEDHHGDMDFKVAGTREGITAVQMDVKVDGIPLSILAEAFEQAKDARTQILDVMEATIDAPRKHISPYAPKIVHMQIDPDKIGLVIGPSGKTITGIKDETGAEIDIEDDGQVFITGKDNGPEKAKEMIEALTHEYRVGEHVEGNVTKILDFGAVVEFGPNTDGLVHISEMAPFRVESVQSILEEGQTVPAVIKEIDKDKGRFSLSIKDANEHFFDDKKPAEAQT